MYPKITYKQREMKIFFPVLQSRGLYNIFKLMRAYIQQLIHFTDVFFFDLQF